RSRYRGRETRWWDSRRRHSASSLMNDPPPASGAALPWASTVRVFGKEAYPQTESSIMSPCEGPVGVLPEIGQQDVLGGRNLQLLTPAVNHAHLEVDFIFAEGHGLPGVGRGPAEQDRKSTRLNSSHVAISYAVFCLKKKKQ